MSLMPDPIIAFLSLQQTLDGLTADPSELDADYILLYDEANDGKKLNPERMK